MPEAKVYIEKLEKKYSGRTVKALYDFDTNWVLAKAPLNTPGGGMDSMFLISKSGSAIKSYLPFDNPTEYLRALDRGAFYYKR